MNESRGTPIWTGCIGNSQNTLISNNKLWCMAWTISIFIRIWCIGISQDKIKWTTKKPGCNPDQMDLMHRQFTKYNERTCRAWHKNKVGYNTVQYGLDASANAKYSEQSLSCIEFITYLNFFELFHPFYSFNSGRYLLCVSERMHR